MRIKSLKYILLLVIITSSAYAGEVQRIKLTDGSVMNAEVISMHEGVYTFKSQSLGEFSVNAKQIQSISSSGMSAPQVESANINLKKLESTLKSKPETMRLITGLQNDPDMQAILSDPEIINALKKGDYSALADNPKFQKLMNNPTMKHIAESVAR